MSVEQLVEQKPQFDPEVRKHQVDNTWFHSLLESIQHYRTFGDHNPLHYFDIPSPLTEGANVRIVPGAVLALNIYTRLAAEEVQEGELSHGYLFTFSEPAIYTADGRIYEGDKVQPGTICTQRTYEPFTGVEDATWVKQDLYGLVGDLWQQQVKEGSNGKAYMLLALTLDATLPPKYSEHDGTHVVNFRRVQLALREMPEKLFLRGLRSYLRLDPAAHFA